MTSTLKPMADIKVVQPEEWLQARRELLIKEKEATRALDALRAERQALPGIQISKTYSFTNSLDNSQKTLSELFEGRKQLVVQHVMFDPTWKNGCSSCAVGIDEIGHLSHLHSRDTTLALVSRAPAEKILAFRKRMGWSDQIPWYSSFESEFNYDFHATIDEEKAPILLNFKDADEVKNHPQMKNFYKGEQPGFSVFFKTDDGNILHTYSAWSRGTEAIVGTYGWLDITPMGRMYDGTDVGMFKLHDEY